MRTLDLRYVPFYLAILVTLALTACSDDAGKQEDTLDDTSTVDGDCCATLNCAFGCDALTCACLTEELDTDIMDGTDTAGEDTATDVPSDLTDTTGQDQDMADTMAEDGVDTAADTNVDTTTDTGTPPLEITWPTTPGDYKADIVAYVDSLYIPADAEGNMNCCKDFGPISKDFIQNGTNGLDNALGELLLVDLAAAIDMNAALDLSIQSGGLVLLFDHKLLDGLDDPDGFILTAMPGSFEAGVTDYFTAAAGSGTFTIDPEAFEPNSGKPATVFNPASMVSADLTAGPEDFFLAIPLGGAVLDIPLQQTDITGAATDQTDGTGFRIGYSDGRVAGYIYLDDFREAINAFVASECSCLGLTGPLYGTSASTWGPSQCMDEAAAQAACADPTPNEVGCIALAANPQCFLLPPLIIGKADIDPDGNGYDAISVGVRYTAVPGQIVGITPAP